MARFEIEKSLKVITYCFLLLIIAISFWAYGWKASAEFDVLVLFFIAYTLLLVLPITDFELSPLSFKGKMKRELKRLVEQSSTLSVPRETVGGIQNELRFFTARSNSDTVLMKLSIDIETTLRNIAESLQKYNEKYNGKKVGMAQLINFLRGEGVITDKWLVEALYFFRVYRNELIHEGKSDDIAKAIDVGTKVLAELKEIQREF